MSLGLHEETEAAETPESTEELWQILQNTWNNLLAKYLEKTVCRRRTGAVLQAERGHTKCLFDLGFFGLLHLA